jgi:hypothetical protein
MADFQGHANHFVPRGHGPVPRPVFRRENFTLILLGKFVALVERQLQRGIMGLQENIRHNHLVTQVGMLSRMARVFV